MSAIFTLNLRDTTIYFVKTMSLSSIVNCDLAMSIYSVRGKKRITYIGRNNCCISFYQDIPKSISYQLLPGLPTFLCSKKYLY
jgi:hypothetical protein